MDWNQMDQVQAPLVQDPVRKIKRGGRRGRSHTIMAARKANNEVRYAAIMESYLRQCSAVLEEGIQDLKRKIQQDCNASQQMEQEEIITGKMKRLKIDTGVEESITDEIKMLKIDNGLEDGPQH